MHRAVLRLGGKARQVVVKVRHPGVESGIANDFRLLRPLAAAASRIPSLRALSLRETLEQQFHNVMGQVRPYLRTFRQDQLCILRHK